MKIRQKIKKKKKKEKKRKAALAKAYELYDKLLKIYKTQYDKLTKAHKKRMTVQNIP